MKILLVHCHYRLPGGEDAVFAAERELLERHGHTVLVYERSTRKPPTARPRRCCRCTPSGTVALPAR